MKGYRFVTQGLTSKHGDVKWEVGKWHKCKGELNLCACGFHASQKPIDSLNYILGTRWFECEARGKFLKDNDKFCASKMRLVKEIPSTILREFAIDCAWRVLHIFERKYPDDKRPRLALEAAKAYLKFPTEENRERMAAARDAAGDAAWDAARDAAVAAARDAARVAAWAAARVAAWVAARDAAWAAERKWQNRHLLNLIKGREK